MTAFSANPGIYIFSIVLLVAMVGYFGWGALDRLGITEQQASATVTGKHYNPPGTTYRTVISGGRAWTQSDATNESYILLLNVGGEATVAVVSKAVHSEVNEGERVRVRLQRTRFSGRLEITGVER
jgi:hypothetical protein